MKYFIDIKRNDLEIISVGIVSEDNRHYYAVTSEFDITKAWDKEDVREDILMPMLKDLSSGQLSSGDIESDAYSIIGAYGLPLNRIASELKLFMSADSKTPKQLYSYDANIVGALFSRLVNEEKPYCRNLEQMMDDKLYNTPFYENADDGIIDAWFGWEKPAEALAMIESYENYPVVQGQDSLASALWNKELYNFIMQLGL